MGQGRVEGHRAVVGAAGRAKGTLTHIAPHAVPAPSPFRNRQLGASLSTVPCWTPAYRGSPAASTLWEVLPLAQLGGQAAGLSCSQGLAHNRGA